MNCVVEMNRELSTLDRMLLRMARRMVPAVNRRLIRKVIRGQTQTRTSRSEGAKL